MICVTMKLGYDELNRKLYESICILSFTNKVDRLFDILWCSYKKLWCWNYHEVDEFMVCFSLLWRKHCILIRIAHVNNHILWIQLWCSNSLLYCSELGNISEIYKQESFENVNEPFCMKIIFSIIHLLWYQKIFDNNIFEEE